MSRPPSLPKHLDVLSDKDLDLGHRAFYLGADGSSAPLTEAEMRLLAGVGKLSGPDLTYFEEMCDSLSRTGEFPFSWTPQEDFFIRNNPRERWLSYLIYRFKFRVLPPRHVVPEFPVHLLIEPTSVCNLRCPMCFQVDDSFRTKTFWGVMDMGLYRDVVDQAVDGGVGALSLGSRGEPFMHKKFGEMLHYASDKKAFFDIKINSNATKLTEKACHDLLSSDVNVIALSIDAHEKDLYESIRVGAEFEKVRDNVARLARLRATEYPNNTAEIRISGVHVSDEQKPEAFQKFWSDYADNIVYVRALPRWDTYANPTHPERDAPCTFLWDRMYVWHNGRCNPCDEDYKSVLDVGDMNTQSLREVWNGPTLTKLRADHLAGQRSSHLPCDRCGV